MVIPSDLAKATHAVHAASWERVDTMISESEFSFGARELVSVRIRPVVEGPNAGFWYVLANISLVVP